MAREIKRKITLLSGVEVQIDPSDYRRACDGSSVKVFDADGTSILRVHQHAESGIFHVYGMNAEGGKIVEANEIVALPDMLPAAVDAIVAHCGIEALREKITLP